MFRKKISLKRFVGLLLLLCPCLLLFSLYETYIQGQHIIPIDKSTGAVLYSGNTFTLGSNRAIVTYNLTETKATVPDPLAGFKTISTSCDGLTFPYKLKATDRWQHVDANASAYVFSAYHEDDDKVKVIGASLTNSGRIRLQCQLWYVSTQSSTISMVVVPAVINHIPEGHGRRYTASLFTCQASRERGMASIMAVSLSTSACARPLNVLPVIQNRNYGVTNNFTICVTPFSNNYARAYELIEWIELNKLLGADKFIFYNFSSAANVQRVLQSYDGLVEVVDWKLPMKIPSWPHNGETEEIHYIGQMASLNECLLRSRGRSEFVVNLDLDEFMIPRGEHVTTWRNMLEQLPATGIYLFANVFFRKEWNSSRTNFTGYEEAQRYRLVSLLRLQHEKQIWAYQQRSKYIVRPYAVETLGIHNVWRKTGSSQNVPHGVALLHHYRNWMKYEDKQERITDDIIVRKYKDGLLSNVIDKWKALPGLVYDMPLCKNPRDFGAC